MSIYSWFPRYACKKLYDGIYDCYDNAMMAYWKDADENMLRDYVSQHEAADYTVYQELDNASVHSITLCKEGMSVHVYLLKRTKELRAIKHREAILPVNPFEYEKICSPAVTQLGTYNAPKVYVGMGYLIRLEDGTFVVIDGGQTPEHDAKLLYDTMCEQKPDGVDGIIISAWIITHGHGDHTGVIRYFMKHYSDKVTVKMIIGNDAPDVVYQSSEDGFVRHFEYSRVSEAFSDCVYMKAHTGQQFFFSGVTFTVLCTHEDFFPNMIDAYNNTSMVMEAVIRGEATKSPVAEGKTRFIWLADVQSNGANRLADMYGEEMKCDVMQIAHHGIGNCSWYELYSLCSPKIAYWPCGRTVLEYKNGTRFTRPHIKFLVDTTEQIVFQAYGSYTMWFDEHFSSAYADGSEFVLPEQFIKSEQ